MKLLGILGGTFDPIHLGHLRTAEEVGQQLRLDKVYLIPSASPPHKTGNPVTGFRHRLAMTRLAMEGSTLLEVLDIEAKRSGPSYSIETLRELHQLLRPNPQFFFILGTDAFFEIDTWKDYRELFRYSHFVIIQRPGFQEEDKEGLLRDEGLDVSRTDNPNIFRTRSGNQLIFMKTTLMDISSTRIRKMASKGESIRFLVPESVRRYIEEEGLYRNHGEPG